MYSTLSGYHSKLRLRCDIIWENVEQNFPHLSLLSCLIIPNVTAKKKVSKQSGIVENLPMPRPNIYVAS